MIFRKRNSDTSSAPSTKSLRRLTFHNPTPFTENKGTFVSLEQQTSNNDYFKHVATPLETSFLQPDSDRVSNTQDFFARSPVLPYKSRHFSIAAPQSAPFSIEEFKITSSQLEKQRTSLPTDAPVAFNTDERKLGYRYREKFKHDSSMIF